MLKKALNSFLKLFYYYIFLLIGKIHTRDILTNRFRFSKTELDLRMYRRMLKGKTMKKNEINHDNDRLKPIGG